MSSAVEIVSGARAAVAELLAAAEREAELVRQRAAEEAAAAQAEVDRRRVKVVEAAQQHRRAVEADVARLVRQRDQVLAQLTNLRSALEGAIALPPEHAEEAAAAS